MISSKRSPRCRKHEGRFRSSFFTGMTTVIGNLPGLTWPLINRRYRFSAEMLLIRNNSNLGGLRERVNATEPRCQPSKVARPSHRIATLDSLRAVVALVVVLHHVWTVFFAQVNAHLAPSALAIWDTIQAQNHRAVMAFFVLSGFTIAMTTDGRLPVVAPATRDYLQRRIRRIVPLFYGSLAWTVAMGAIYGYRAHDFSWRILLGNLLLLQTSAGAKGTWFVPFGSNGPYWSLSYEMAYYAVLPLALMGAGARTGSMSNVRHRLILFGLTSLVIGMGVLQVAPNPFALFASLWIVWVAGFVVYGLAPERRSLPLVALPALCCWGILGGLALVGRTSATALAAVEGTSLALVFGVMTTWRGWTAIEGVRLIDRGFNAAFSQIGRGSYALYLLHYPLLLAVHRVLTDRKGGSAEWTLAGLLMLAFVIWFCPWVERLSQALFARIAVSRQPPL